MDIRRRLKVSDDRDERRVKAVAAVLQRAIELGIGADVLVPLAEAAIRGDEADEDGEADERHLVAARLTTEEIFG